MGKRKAGMAAFVLLFLAGVLTGAGLFSGGGDVEVIVITAVENSDIPGTRFAPIPVIDSGQAFPEHQEYSGVACNIKDTRNRADGWKPEEGRSQYTVSEQYPFFSTQRRHQSFWGPCFFHVYVYSGGTGAEG